MRCAALAMGLLAACRFDGSGPPAGNATIDAADNPAETDAAVDAGIADAGPDATVDATVCPAGYATIPGRTSQYKLYTAGKAWLDAEHDCEDDGPGTHLVVIDDGAELTLVRGRLQGKTWIGMSDLVKEDEFLRVIGGAAFESWNGGEPNSLFGQEDCVEISGDGFNDETCSHDDDYLCECDGAVPVPAAYTPP